MPDTTHFSMLEAIAKGQVGPPTTAIALVNGLNSNIATPATGRLRITGPSSAFSVGGFVGGVDGRRVRIYNAVAQTMTIVNEDASSTAANRITTLSGSNVVLRTTAKSFFTLSYDGTDSRWILESSN
jgi:hypothetical protein